jgi:hypothetical protein
MLFKKHSLLASSIFATFATVAPGPASAQYTISCQLQVCAEVTPAGKDLFRFRNGCSYAVGFIGVIHAHDKWHAVGFPWFERSLVQPGGSKYLNNVPITGFDQVPHRWILFVVSESDYTASLSDRPRARANAITQGRRMIEQCGEKKHHY